MKFTSSKYWYRVTLGAIALGLAGGGVCALLIFGTASDNKKEGALCTSETSVTTAHSDLSASLGSKSVGTSSVQRTNVLETTTTVSTKVTTTSTTTTETTTLTTTQVVETTEIILTEPLVEETLEPVYYNDYITDYEHILLANCVANEYDSDWVSVYDKACVVATVMNRVSSNKWPNTIEGVLTQPDQFTGYWACGYYWDKTTPSCKEAVDYYFSHQEEFPYYTGFWGDGTYNHFY